jgi:hypothetical protein
LVRISDCFVGWFFGVSSSSTPHCLTCCCFISHLNRSQGKISPQRKLEVESCDQKTCR